MFTGLNSLMHLNLTSNFIAHIQPSTPNNMPSLVTLSIRLDSPPNFGRASYRGAYSVLCSTFLLPVSNRKCITVFDYLFDECSVENNVFAVHENKIHVLKELDHNPLPCSCSQQQGVRYPGHLLNVVKWPAKEQVGCSIYGSKKFLEVSINNYPYCTYEYDCLDGCQCCNKSVECIYAYMSLQLSSPMQLFEKTGRS